MAATVPGRQTAGAVSRYAHVATAASAVQRAVSRKLGALETGDNNKLPQRKTVDESLRVRLLFRRSCGCSSINNQQSTINSHEQPSAINRRGAQMKNIAMISIAMISIAMISIAMISAAWLVLAGAAVAQMEMPKPGPEMKKLNMFAGTWT